MGQEAAALTARQQEIYEGVIGGKREIVSSGVAAELEAGTSPGSLLFDVLIPAMKEVGDRFERNEFFVPEMLIAARAMQAGLGILKPHLAEGGIEAAGKVAIGTVQGDLHDIGKNLVAMMLEGAGFEVNDLGVDVGPDAFVQAVQDGAQVIGMSALLTTTMNNMGKTVQALQESGLRDQVKVIIGGAPVTDAYAQQIGADAFAPDASSATRAVRELLA